MTKEEAIKAMRGGEKVTHEYFTPDEYIKRGSIRDIEFEDGCQCSEFQFWQYRKEECWNDGWRIFNG